MNWKINGIQKSYAAIVVLILAASGATLAYVSGVQWRTAGWAILGVIAIMLVAVLGNIVYAIVSLEKGYGPVRSSGAGTEGLPKSPVTVKRVLWNRDTSGERLNFPVFSQEAKLDKMPSRLGQQPAVGRSARLQDALADLEAAEYLLSKIENSPAFRDFTDDQRRRCQVALAQVRDVLTRSAEKTAEHRFVS